MRRHSHNCSCAVTGEHILAHPHRHLFAGKWINGIRACEDTCHLSGLGHSFTLCLLLCKGKILLNGTLLLRCSQLLHPVALRSKHHKGNSKDRIGTGGEDCHIVLLFAARSDGLEDHLRTLRLAYPVALHLLERICPIQFIQSCKQPLCIGGDSKLPLLHLLLLYRVASSYRVALLNLVVSKHGTKGRTPVNGGLTLISNSVLHKNIAAAPLVKGIPLLRAEGWHLSASGINIGITLFGKTLHKFSYREGLICCFVIIMPKHLKESPLCPLVVVRVAGSHLSLPIVGEAYLIHLLAIPCNIGLRSLGRMLSGLDCILLCRESESIITHRMEHIKALQSLVPGKDITCNIPQRMSHVQARPGGIREHIQNIILWLTALLGYPEGMILCPESLPLLLNFYKIVLHSLCISLFLNSKPCPVLHFKIYRHRNFYSNTLFIMKSRLPLWRSGDNFNYLIIYLFAKSLGNLHIAHGTILAYNKLYNHASVNTIPKGTLRILYIFIDPSLKELHLPAVQELGRSVNLPLGVDSLPILSLSLLSAIRRGHIICNPLFPLSNGLNIGHNILAYTHHLAIIQPLLCIVYSMIIPAITGSKESDWNICGIKSPMVGGVIIRMRRHRHQRGGALTHIICNSIQQQVMQACKDLELILSSRPSHTA